MKRIGCHVTTGTKTARYALGGTFALPRGQGTNVVSPLDKNQSAETIARIIRRGLEHVPFIDRAAWRPRRSPGYAEPATGPLDRCCVGAVVPGWPLLRARLPVRRVVARRLLGNLRP